MIKSEVEVEVGLLNLRSVQQRRVVYWEQHKSWPCETPGWVTDGKWQHKRVPVKCRATVEHQSRPTRISWAVHHPGMKPGLEEFHLLFYCCKWNKWIANIKPLDSFRSASLVSSFGPTCFFFSLNLIRAVQVGASIIYIWLWPAGSCVLEKMERLLAFSMFFFPH